MAVEVQNVSKRHERRGSLTLRKKAAILIVAAFAMLMGSALPAAASTKNWSFSGSCCVYSSLWDSAGAGTHTIKVTNRSECIPIRFTLQQRNALGGWSSQGEKSTTTCSTTGASWTNMPDDTYRFYMTIDEPARDDRNFAFSGTVTYP